MIIWFNPLLKFIQHIPPASIWSHKFSNYEKKLNMFPTQHLTSTFTLEFEVPGYLYKIYEGLLSWATSNVWFTKKVMWGLKNMHYQQYFCRWNQVDLRHPTCRAQQVRTSWETNSRYSCEFLVLRFIKKIYSCIMQKNEQICNI